MTVFGTEVLFDGYDPSGHEDAWITDGTVNGTSELHVSGAFLTLFGDTPPLFSILDAQVLFAGDAAVPPPCYAAATHICTVRGDTAVEELRVGDSVITAAGQAKPIVWIGERRLDFRRHLQPKLVWPVRIRAGAFAENLPHRDLWLSPDHAVFQDGVLIPIKYLINGVSVVQERVDFGHYFHLELDRHDILLAEGLPAESYLDTGNRNAFATGAAHMMLDPEFSPLSWESACAPLCTEGRVLTAVRGKLRNRLIEMSVVRVLVDKRSVQPVAIKGRLHRFLLPANTRELEIAPRENMTTHDGGVSVLEVYISGIIVDSKMVPLDSSVLADGFCPIERHGTLVWRWTNGATRLTLPKITRSAVLEILVGDAMGSWER